MNVYKIPKSLGMDDRGNIHDRTTGKFIPLLGASVIRVPGNVVVMIDPPDPWKPRKGSVEKWGEFA